MATLLGSTSKPTYGNEWWSSGSNNQVAIKLTLPSGGPWKLLTGGGWLRGWTSSVTAYMCVWRASDGVLLGYSNGITVTGAAEDKANSLNWGGVVDGEGEYVNGSGYLSVAGSTELYVGWSTNTASGRQFATNNTSTHYDKDTGGVVPDDHASASSHSRTIGAYLYYEEANSLPDVPTLNSPVGGVIVASQTPTLNFTPHDPDADNHTEYTFQVDNNSDFSSVTDSLVVAGTFTDGVAINDVVGDAGSGNTTPLTRGVTYYWRVKTKDAVGYGSYSAASSFKVAVLPTASVTAPANAQTGELYFTAGTAGNPKIKARWSYSCTDGHAQERAVIRIYADSGGSPGSLLNTDTYTGTAVSFDTTYAVVENTKYHVSVQPRCSLLVEGVESSKNITRTRWARASYFFDSGSTPVTLSAAADTTVGATQAVVLEYTATASTSEPGTWYANVSSAGLQRYFWHRATMFAWGSATPSSPKLNSVTWTYSANALTLDDWTVASGASVDTGTYVYGSQSLKHATNGAVQKSYQDVTVTPNTLVILSGRIKTSGVPVASLEVHDIADTVTLGSVSATSDTDWTRYATAAFNTGSATSVRVMCVTNASAGKTAWFDALKLEASTVVTPWTPGFIASAVALDAGGVQINAQAGGVFRLKGSAGGVRDIVALGANGLVFGGDTPVYSPSAALLRIDSGVLLSSDARIYRSAAATLTFDDGAGGSVRRKHAPLGALARRTTTQSINDVTWTGISFNASEDFDPFAFHSTATNPSRFTVPTGWAGTYLLVCNLGFASFTATVMQMGFGINGANPPVGQNHFFAANTVNSPSQSGVWITELAAGDYIEFMLYHNNGVAQNTVADMYGSIMYLGERV
jgi:hypothetical protein